MLKVGLLGLGTVGGGVVKILKERKKDFKAILGQELCLVKVLSRRDNRLKELDISPDIFTTSFEDFLLEPMDIVVEAIGGDAPAETISKALAMGLKVVTANKALLATRSQEFIGTEHGERLFFEASCCGGIPIISSFEEGLLSNRIQKILGIFNGTCNYILSEMTKKGEAFQTVLDRAQSLGYAEADPTFDVEGIDATHKLCLLGSLAFQRRINFKDIAIQGISKLRPEDFSWAKENGYTIKLISMGDNESDSVFAGTFPCMIPSTHPLSNVNGANNAVFVQGEYVGDLMFYGAGAGEFPTASAVVSDILAAAQGRTRTWSQRVFRQGEHAKLVNDRDFSFYLRLRTKDEVGVLSKLCDSFGKNGISLCFVHQNPTSQGEAQIIFTTHPTQSMALETALQDISSKNLLSDTVLVMRILDI
jgi:homoserine dehydrogenase